MKRCSKCGKEKLIDNFNKNKNRPDGLAHWCKKCHSFANKKYREQNIEKVSEAKEKWKKENPNYQKEYSEKYKKIACERSRKYYILNKNKVLNYGSNWRKKNKERMRSYRSKWQKNRYKNNVKFRLKRVMSYAIWRTLKSNKANEKWEKFVDYSLSDLKSHLENQFQIGMSWNNYGKWHIDHKIPISAFNFSDPLHLDFKRCWELNNLQPMWSKENLSKGAKIKKHFQPSLKLGVV